MSIKWRNFTESPPVDGERCLTEMKHGLIEGTWDADGGFFEGYYFQTIQWWASRWVPMEELGETE